MEKQCYGNPKATKFSKSKAIAAEEKQVRVVGLKPVLLPSLLAKCLHICLFAFP